MVWRREPIGTLQPVTLRPIFLILGAILMLGMFIMMLTTRDFARRLDRGANERPAVDAGIPLLLAFERHWPGTTEAERWAKANDSASNAVQRET